MFLLVLFFVKFHIRIRSNIAIVGLFVLLSLSLLLLVLPSFVGILDICLVGILVIEAHLCLLEIIIRLETMIRRRSNRFTYHTSSDLCDKNIFVERMLMDDRGSQQYRKRYDDVVGIHVLWHAVYAFVHIPGCAHAISLICWWEVWSRFSFVAGRPGADPWILPNALSCVAPLGRVDKTFSYLSGSIRPGARRHHRCIRERICIYACIYAYTPASPHLHTSQLLPYSSYTTLTKLATGAIGLLQFVHNKTCRRRFLVFVCNLLSPPTN